MSSVKSFVRQAYFSHFKQDFERKQFSANNQIFLAYIKESKTRLACENLYVSYKQRLTPYSIVF